MIYDITPSVFISQMEHRYEHLFYAPPYIIEGRLFTSFYTTERYVVTSISIGTNIDNVQYINKRMKT